MFVALHDVLDERMGPTYFWPSTHAPRCFPGEVWRPPTELLAANLRSVWYALHAGDAMLMDACTWHRGGANTSGFRRTLLAASFVASDGVARVPRLGDFVDNETELINIPTCRRAAARRPRTRSTAARSPGSASTGRA